jgi:hypothetical protein
MTDYTITFIDIHHDFIKEIKKLFNASTVPTKNIKYKTARVESINTRHTAFVSPANSLGYMDV